MLCLNSLSQIADAESTRGHFYKDAAHFRRVGPGSKRRPVSEAGQSGEDVRLGEAGGASPQANPRPGVAVSLFWRTKSLGAGGMTTEGGMPSTARVEDSRAEKNGRIPLFSASSMTVW